VQVCDVEARRVGYARIARQESMSIDDPPAFWRASAEGTATAALELDLAPCSQ
jgi:hypothetical protein